jgi:hypothetical protein
MLVAVLVALLVPAAEASAAPSALARRALADLARFTEWLGAEHGIVGEVGWPGNPAAAGDARWNDVARAWYAAADDAGLWVAAWSTGEFWQSSYKLLVYAANGGPVGSPNPQASVLEGQPHARLRGINVAGPEFASPIHERTSSFSNARPGVYGVDYVYPSQATLDFLAARGVTFVRLPIRWERIQPRLGAPLDGEEGGRLLEALARARAAGLGVVVDVHNYGAYYLDDGRGRGVRRALGSSFVPVAAFVDLWRRLSALLEREAGVLGYGLMNEPWGMRDAATWERASRAAARAIRTGGDSTRILVQSYDWGGTLQFPRNHPRGPWIHEPNVWYEAHQYFDADRSARYAASYDEEAALAARAPR